jgi:TPR repeat protein
VFHENGLGGLCIDKQEALRWYSAAAENGNVNARENLKFLQKEIGLGKRTPHLLERLFSNIWVTKPPTGRAGTITRCSSSPGSLLMESDLESKESSRKSIANRDSDKCIWVI